MTVSLCSSFVTAAVSGVIITKQQSAEGATHGTSVVRIPQERNKERAIRSFDKNRLSFRRVVGRASKQKTEPHGKRRARVFVLIEEALVGSSVYFVRNAS